MKKMLMRLLIVKFGLWMYQYINYISYCLWVGLYSCVVRRSVILNSHEVGKSRIAIVYWTILFPFCGLIRIIHLFSCIVVK